MKSANENPVDAEAQFLAQLGECQGIVLKICRIYGPTADDRNDLRQEILANAWRSWPGFRGDSKFSTWLYKIALNTALMARRRRERKPMVDLNFREPSEPPVEPGPTEIERLYEAISRLDDAEKSLILLWLDDLAYTEMAEITGLSVNHIGVKLNRIRQKLRGLMAEN